MRGRLDRLLAGMRGDWVGAAQDGVADDGPLAALAGVDVDDAPSLASSRLPRLRPVLVVLAARASGGKDVDPELQYAAELLNAALYVHDVAVGPRGNRRRKLARRLLRGVDGLGAHKLLLRSMELVRQGGQGHALGDLVLIQFAL